jgi:hypothetical protein
MLTSFFGKSNPINFLVLSIYIIIGYFLGVVRGNEEILNFEKIGIHLIFLGMTIFSMFLLDFIVKKNALSRPNNYDILFFVCFLVIIPVALTNKTTILANVLVLLALRRILSLYSEKNMEKKVLDASLYITAASLFYFYSLFFFVVLFLAIIRKNHTTYKHLFIPFAGFCTVFALTTTYHFLVNDSFNWFYSWIPITSLDFSEYNNIVLVIGLSIIGAFVVWTTFFRLIKLSSISRKERPNYLLVIIVLLATLAMAFFSEEKTGAEFLFILAPAAIITANYIEKINEFWFRELLLWLMVITPIVLLFV